MRNFKFSFMAALFTMACATGAAAEGLTDSLTAGKAEMQSIGAIAFGPDGVLFAGDPMGASIYAFDTVDTQFVADAAEIEGVGAKVAALLGTTADQILINDMAVNPLSKRAYLSVSRGRGPDAMPVIVRTAASGNLEVVSLDNIAHAKAMLSNPPSADAVNRRGVSLRTRTITDIAYVGDRVVVAGLSNEEFSSNLRTIPFPFISGSISRGASIEIYHGSHGRFETQAPVRTFTSHRVGNEDVILASYTCTPLVVFRTNELADGNKVMGKTIAELGSGNTPLDMFVYAKDGASWIMMSNTRRGVMKISAENLERFNSITSEIDDVSGVPFETLPYEGVQRLAQLDDSHALMLIDADGALSLRAVALP